MRSAEALDLSSANRKPMAKAGIVPEVPISLLRDLTAEAIRVSHGKARAAAIDLGIHEASLSRQLKDGSLRLEQLETLGHATLAELGRQLVDHFGPLTSPLQRYEHLRRQRMQIDTELDQFTESLIA